MFLFVFVLVCIRDPSFASSLTLYIFLTTRLHHIRSSFRWLSFRFVSFVHQVSYKQSPFSSHRRLLLDQPPALEFDRLPFQVAPADGARPSRRGWYRLGLDLQCPSFPASLPRLPSPITDQQQHANEHDKDDRQDDEPQVERSARPVVPSRRPIDTIIRSKIGRNTHIHREHGCGKKFDSASSINR